MITPVKVVENPIYFWRATRGMVMTGSVMTRMVTMGSLHCRVPLQCYITTMGWGNAWWWGRGRVDKGELCTRRGMVISPTGSEKWRRRDVLGDPVGDASIGVTQGFHVRHGVKQGWWEKKTFGMLDCSNNFGRAEWKLQSKEIVRASDIWVTRSLSQFAFLNRFSPGGK